MKFSRIFLAILILVIVIFGYAWKTIYTPMDINDNKEISFIIKSGTSAKEITEQLKKDGLVKSGTAFYTYIRLMGEDKNITAGRFMLKKSMTVPDIVNVITIPTVSEAVITIREGLTVKDIDKELTKQKLIRSGEFMQAVKDFNDYASYPFLNREVVSKLEFPLEGYLYPDTYFVDGLNFSSKKFIIKMLNNFKTKFNTVKPLFDTQNRSLHEIITMASILQKEVRTSKDYNIISGILWKRLDSNWHIGADATILYATGKKNIEVEDLDIDSPYNTRLHTGMPPGPISNPDIEHIKAAITPEDSDYWYYLTTPDTGEVVYAKTNNKQNINKAKYLY
ncbi:endolytic transglycosylase MltG [bacterium]|nr:endolytic transglycosylase MltG [bacterium]